MKMREAGSPFILAAAAALVVPILWLLSYSLEFSLMPFRVSFRHWVEVWRLLEMPRYFLNSFLITGIGIAISLALSSTMGYGLAMWRKFPGGKLAWAMVMIAFVVPNFFAIFVNFWMMANVFPLAGIRLIDTYLGVVLPFGITGFGVLFMRQGFLGIPRDLRDAARIDGAGEWYIFFRVMAPLVKPYFASLAVVEGLAFWNLFLWPLIVLKSGEKYPLSLGIMHLAGLFSHDPRVTAAAAVMMMIPLVLLFLFAQRWFLSDLLSGSIKQ